MIKMQTFLGDGGQQIRRYGNVDLRLHRVLAGAKEVWKKNTARTPSGGAIAVEIPLYLIKRGSKNFIVFFFGDPAAALTLMRSHAKKIANAPLQRIFYGLVMFWSVVIASIAA